MEQSRLEFYEYDVLANKKGIEAGILIMNSSNSTAIIPSNSIIFSGPKFTYHCDTVDFLNCTSCGEGKEEKYIEVEDYEETLDRAQSKCNYLR